MTGTEAERRGAGQGCARVTGDKRGPAHERATHPLPHPFLRCAEGVTGGEGMERRARRQREGGLGSECVRVVREVGAGQGGCQGDGRQEGAG